MGYFKTIPFELEECALIDGASRWQILTKIVVPLAIPGLISAFIFCFTLCWNEFIYALTFLQSTSNKTVPVAIVNEFVDGDIYLVQRGWNALQTTSFDGERAFGVPDWGDEQTYLGASSFILEQISPSSWPDPDESKHGFELVYAPEITCNQVLSTAGAIFESQ